LGGGGERGAGGIKYPGTKKVEQRQLKTKKYQSIRRGNRNDKTQRTGKKGAKPTQKKDLGKVCKKWRLIKLKKKKNHLKKEKGGTHWPSATPMMR